MTIYNYIDYTNLKPTATDEDIKALCERAMEYETASVCIQPCYVKFAREHIKDPVKVCTVIGFPMGYQETDVKVFEAKKAVADGADEVDMVINLTDMKNGRYDQVMNEIKAIKEAVGNKILKVIVETCYLTEDEKVKITKIVSESGADFIKTSTGMGTGGATLEDIALFNEHRSDKLRMKASGGVRDAEAAQKFIDLGCTRIGTSGIVGQPVGTKNEGY